MDFINTTWGRAFTIGIFFIIFYTPYCLAYGVKKIAYGKKNVTAKDWYLAMIPIVNNIIADKVYFGKIWMNSFGVFALAIFPIRLLTNMTPIAQNHGFNLFMVIMMILCTLFWYGSNVYTSFVIMYDSQVMGKVKAILYSIIFPIGYWYINSFLCNIVSLNNDLDTNVKGFDL